jgi:transcriptional regulator
MYLPPAFSETNEASHFDLIEAFPLGLLISSQPEGPIADLVPFLLDRSERKLQAHVAKANPQWRNLAAGASPLIVFQASDHYVTPSWYRTKAETGKVVPTWNYIMVQVEGSCQVIEDADWLRRQIDRLTERHEYQRPAPWAVSDAPVDFVTAQIRGIIGIEIAITRTIGKWKVSQNRSPADREGVVSGLETTGTAEALEMAREVRLKA